MKGFSLTVSLVIAALFTGCLTTPTAHATVSSLFELVKTGMTQDIRDAIHKGADVNARDTIGRTALMFAVTNNPDAIKVLLAAGADVNARDQRGLTPLIRATLDCAALLSYRGLPATLILDCYCRVSLQTSPPNLGARRS